jgi:hypothetical protein
MAQKQKAFVCTLPAFLDVSDGLDGSVFEWCCWLEEKKQGLWGP